MRIAKSTPSSSPSKMPVATSRPLAEIGSTERRRNSPSYNQATRVSAFLSKLQRDMTDFRAEDDRFSRDIALHGELFPTILHQASAARLLGYKRRNVAFAIRHRKLSGARCIANACITEAATERRALDASESSQEQQHFRARIKRRLRPYNATDSRATKRKSPLKSVGR